MQNEEEDQQKVWEEGDRKLQSGEQVEPLPSDMWELEEEYAFLV
jgi:hypothetical protein